MGWVLLHWGTNDYITPKGSFTNAFYSNMDILSIKHFPHLVRCTLEDKLLPAYMIIVNS